ncbi:1050a8c8-eafe-43c4-9415-83ad50356db6 [Thermothielavioides terrestris]|uniref:1050a8c8-eafe-43c4-9415-83ad50356db6 n=1 Tax=Thermothielavioides terrestris TaxID=2587410 RepID=A0A446BKV8_9PEZI|nr:1050a8c8-eafe-43c4-9415-83ad50356db6 [Thermothielavioides terrestris]
MSDAARSSARLVEEVREISWQLARVCWQLAAVAKTTYKTNRGFPTVRVPNQSQRSSESSAVSVYHQAVQYQPGGDTDTETEAHSSRQASPSSSTFATTAAEDVWSYSEPSPGSKKKLLIYPKARFEFDPWTALKCADRFRFATEQLHALVHTHLRLDDFENRPTYSPRMVGS